MNRFVVTSALALAIATPALASDQLANYAGVEPGAYTTNEVIELIDARQDQDWSRVRAIVTGSTKNTVADNRTSVGHVQLARSLAVEPADFSTNQLTELRAAVTDQDWSRVRYIKRNASPDGGVSGTFSTNSRSVSAGHVQLARSLDVDPAAFTTNDLLLLKSAQQEGDWTRVRYILNNAGS